MNPRFFQPFREDELYQEIMQQAINMNTVFFDTLLKKAIPVDCLEPAWFYNESLLSPAGQLATKGHHNAVQLLLKYGADIQTVANGYAFSGDLDKIKQLYTDNPLEKNELAMFASFGEQLELTQHYVAKDASFTSFVLAGAAMAGNWDRVNSLHHDYQHKDNHLYITLGVLYRILALSVNQHEQENYLKKALSLCPQMALTSIVSEYSNNIKFEENKETDCFIDIIPVMQRAKEIRRLMKSLHWNYEDASGHQQAILNNKLMEDENHVSHRPF